MAKGGLWRFAAVLLLICGLAAAGFGQATSSAILGMLKDASGASMPGVTVTIRNVETGVARTAQSDPQGRYRVGELGPGTYEVTATMPGFSTETRKDVPLQVGQELSLNFVLQVGAVEQTVEVTGAAPTIETTTSTVSGEVNAQQLRELPLLGRSFTDLITLQSIASTTSTASASPNYGNGPMLTVAGARSDANNFMIDGTDMNLTTNGSPGSAARVQMGVDTIREFQVITSNAKAEYGRGSGAVINAVTRSGTNQIHGSVFEFLRNSDLDARSWTDGSTVPPFRQNQFGATLGGPIQRDKTFYFLGWESLRQRLDKTQISDVPTAAVHANPGSFLGAGQAVAPVMLPYLALWPLPNGPILSAAQGIGVYSAAPAQPVNEDYGSARIDHTFSDKDFMFGRYTIDRSTATTYGDLDTNNIVVAGSQYVTVQEDHMFSPTLLNTYRMGYNRSVTLDTPTNVPNTTALGFVPGQPIGALAIGGGFSGIGPGATVWLTFVQNTFQFEDSLSYTRGAHTMKFGAMAERFQWNNDEPTYMQGTITFSNLQQFLTAGTISTATLVLPTSNTYRHLRSTLMAFYGQDDYKVTPNLTLNLGLRWEFTTGLSETDGLLSHFTQGPVLSPGPATGIGAGSGFINHIGNVAPRVGFNWALGKSQKTVLSGGIGTFFSQNLGNTMISFRNQLPWYYRAIATNVTAGAAFPNLQAIEAAYVSFNSTREYDYSNFKTPTTYRYNLTVQRELPGGLKLHVGYVGSNGFHLLHRSILNAFPNPIVAPNGTLYFPCGPTASSTCPNPAPQALNPNYGQIEWMASDAYANYNAVTAGLDKRFSKGVTFQLSYTVSRSLDDASQSESFYSTSSADLMYAGNRTLDYGPSNFDIPQNFVGNVVYELPFGPGKALLNSHGVLAAVVGGWQAGTIVSIQSGVPFTPTTSAVYPGFGYNSTRPNLVPGTNRSAIVGGPPSKYFTTSAFSLQPAGTLGNSSRDSLRGPAQEIVNFSMSKVFNLTERMHLQFRGEFFNFFNHPGLGVPNSALFASTSGVVSASAGVINSLTPSGVGRQVQLGLKLIF